MSKQQHLVTVTFIRLHTKTSGDTLSETGEWYIKTNGRRFPDAVCTIIYFCNQQYRDTFT